MRPQYVINKGNNELNYLKLQDIHICDYKFFFDLILVCHLLKGSRDQRKGRKYQRKGLVHFDSQIIQYSLIYTWSQSAISPLYKKEDGGYKRGGMLKKSSTQIHWMGWLYHCIHSGDGQWISLPRGDDVPGSRFTGDGGGQLISKNLIILMVFVGHTII